VTQLCEGEGRKDSEGRGGRESRMIQCNVLFKKTGIWIIYIHTCRFGANVMYLYVLTISSRNTAIFKKLTHVNCI